jgi:eukaryotic-like serine/threonine-protein kinase
MPELTASLSTAFADRYRVDDQVGAGGMATVFRAHDLKHDRIVAIKVPHRGNLDSVSAARFLQEIRTTARLQHPHILPLYDSGAADGVLFYVMPFVEGESLRERIQQLGQLPVDEALRLSREIADALTYAHGQGVVHRDVTPSNVLIANGHAVVTDFGLALAASRSGGFRLTVGGERTGTPQYMSPEQAAGEENIDARSDIFSLGCVLYEMLAGGPPFTGGSPEAVVAQRFLGPPPSIRDRRPDVPHSVDAAIRTAMALEPRDRFQSAARFSDALTLAGPGTDMAAEVHKSIVVLPFTNMSADGDAEFFADGITEDLLNALGRLPGLRVIARASSFALKDTNLDLREVGERLGVRNVLEGSVRKAGTRLRLSARLVDARDGRQLWSERYDREVRDVFAVQDEITAAIRDALSQRLFGLGPAQAHTPTSIDPETYESFLRGRYFIAKRAEGMQKGMEQLAEVVTRAPRYAPAYAELANAHGLATLFCAMPPSAGWPKVQELADAALQLDAGLARAHAELGNAAFWYAWDWDAAKAHYERAMSLDPNDPWPNALFGHFLASIGQHEEAVALCERARALDPLNPSVSASLATMHFLAEDHEQAIAVCDRIVDQDPTFSDAYRLQAAALRELGRVEEAAPVVKAAVTLSGRHPWAVSLEGMVAARAGRVADAEEVVRELVERHDRGSGPFVVPPLAVALVYSQLEQPDSYFEWMSRALQARDGWLVMLGSDPSYRHLDDPRHAELVQRVGIPSGAAGLSSSRKN